MSGHILLGYFWMYGPIGIVSRQVNFAEFFLTLTGAAVFTLLMETNSWIIIMGLVFGGLFVAPFAAVLCKTLHARTLLILVGILIVITSLYNLYRGLVS